GQGVAAAVGVVAGLGERAHAAHEVAAAGLLDLDHLGALLAEQRRAERGGDPRAEVEDAQALEGPPHGRHPQPCFLVGSSPASRSAKPSFIEVRCLRASRAFRAVAVLWVKWWAMKWYCQD